MPDKPPHSPPRLPAQLISPADSINRRDAAAAESQAIMENGPGALELTLTAGLGVLSADSGVGGGRTLQANAGQPSCTRRPPGAPKRTAPADSVPWAAAWASRLLSPHITQTFRRERSLLDSLTLVTLLHLLSLLGFCSPSVGCRHDRRHLSAIRNAGSQAPPWTNWVRICILTNPGEMPTHVDVSGPGSAGPS